jgi:L-aminopeptidase/D-esterase-like protein
VVAEEWLLPVAAETWDGYLNDINGFHVKPEDAFHASRLRPLRTGRRRQCRRRNRNDLQ